MKTTDVHIHLLPGVDDGARDEGSSLRMLEIAYLDGIRTIICTPHFHGGYMESSAEANTEAFNKLKSIVDANYPEMKIYLGNEVYYFDSMDEWLNDGRLLTMAGSRYVLVEFSPGVSLRVLDSAVRHLTQSGYMPILAHINRYIQLVGDIRHVYDLIDNGAYIQINTEALNGQMGHKVKKFTKKLLKTNSVHFIASDAHSSRNRRPELAQTANYIAKKYGEEVAIRIFCDNPQKVIDNEII